MRLLIISKITWKKLQKIKRFFKKKTFYGKEKAPLAYIIGVMNMILHGVEAPNIIHTNNAWRKTSEIFKKKIGTILYWLILHLEVVKEKKCNKTLILKQVKTAFLFMQHFIKSLKTGGRAGSGNFKNTFSSNSDATALRQHVLESCNLHTIMDMPAGTFKAGIRTVILFFQKGEPTKSTWFYQMKPGRNMGKTNPLNDKDMAEFYRATKNKARYRKVLEP